MFAILDGRLSVDDEDWDLAIELIINNAEVIRWVTQELAEYKGWLALRNGGLHALWGKRALQCFRRSDGQ